MRVSKARGFTLIELMIVVAIIAALAAVAIPKFGQMLRSSNDGATKGNLGAIRSALSIYYGENTFYPTAGFSGSSSILSDALVPKYMDSIPLFRDNQYHGTGNQVMNYIAIDTWPTDWVDHWGGSNWIYDGYCGTWTGPPWVCSFDGKVGTIWVNCSHTDSKGTQWASY